MAEGSISLEEEAEVTLRRYAYHNAHAHGGKARVEVVVAKTLAEKPAWRALGKRLSQLAEALVQEVNSLTLEAQRRVIEEQWPEMLETKPTRAVEKALPPLPNVVKYAKVKTRFSPNPDCALHIGSARAIVLSWEYAHMYNGEFYLRFEDTDPKVKKPALEFYDSIREDLSWLECTPKGEVTQSARLHIYYQYAEELFKLGNAYVCTCNPESFRKLITASVACPCRNLPPESSLDRWQRMLSAEYAEGAAVVRVKTDLSHPNPAVRDWPALRIVDIKKTPHPLVDAEHSVWPLYNFSAAVDDHLMGITHIIRGKEHLTNEVRQRFLYSHLGWEYPEAIHYGRLKITGAELSKSKIKLGVERGIYKGYGDPRLATFAALRKRGISPQAVRRMMIDVGVNPNDVTLSWETLYTYNRRIIDPTSKRFFFVPNPIILRVQGVTKPYIAAPNLHPDHANWGKRRLEVTPSDGYVEVFISRDDLSLASPNATLRLMGLFNITVGKASMDHVEAQFCSESYADAKTRKARLIQFLPSHEPLPARIIMPTGETVSGFAENQCAQLQAGETIQFERFGFVRVENVAFELTAYYAHK